MTVRDIIAEPLLAHRIVKNKAEANDLVYSMLERVGLTKEHAGRYAHEFSGGQRQRVGIARALILKPELVICDEPISALDVSIQAQVINLLKDYQDEQGVSYLFIAHDLSMVRYVSDDVGVMYLGQLVEISEADEIYKNPLHPYTKGLLGSIPHSEPKACEAEGKKQYRGRYSKSHPAAWRLPFPHQMPLREAGVRRENAEAYGCRERAQGCLSSVLRTSLFHQVFRQGKALSETYYYSKRRRNYEKKT